MSIEKALYVRGESKCELCGSTESLGVYEVPPGANGDLDKCLLICELCRQQIDSNDAADVHHWRCLSASIWSQVPAVQVTAWRMLKRLSAEGWAQDLLDTVYLDEDTQAWAQATDAGGNDEDVVKHIDSNGVALAAGDTVTLIKDLNVKGTSFTAKRGTAVRGISLVADNPEHIEGRVNGQQIVILTKFVKKTN